MEEKEHTGKSSPVYVRVRNLPWSACHKEVRQFCHSLHIPDGHISIYDDEAFIYFDSMRLLQETHLKDSYEINGKEVSLSVIKLKEFRKRIYHHARRTLTFGTSENLSITILKEDENVPLTKRRKIRPTSVDEDIGLTERDNSDNDMRFQPEEIDYPETAISSNGMADPPRYRKPLKNRKIHPTSMPKMENYNKNSLFFCEETDYVDDFRNTKREIPMFAPNGAL